MFFPLQTNNLNAMPLGLREREEGERGKQQLPQAKIHSLRRNLSELLKQ